MALFFSMQPRRHFRIPLPGGRTLALGERTLVMGILNITPDSFSDGGAYLDPSHAVDAGLRMVAEGADILDVGGESTRPGSDPVGAHEEMRRVLPVVAALATQTQALISVDTYRATVAREAVARGATIINDISGLQYDPALGEVAAACGAALILMHTRGRSSDMYARANYTDTLTEVAAELQQALDRATDAGVPREALILDPGFGFAKRAEHSYALLARLGELAVLGRPLLSGPSRKSFLKEPLGERSPSEREWATAAAVTASVLEGAHIVRVHAVREMVDVVRVTDRIAAAHPPA